MTNNLERQSFCAVKKINNYKKKGQRLSLALSLYTLFLFFFFYGQNMNMKILATSHVCVRET